MKRRLFTILNFCALNILFFSLYLNFIHKDQNVQKPVPGTAAVQVEQGAKLVDHPERFLQQGPINSDQENLARN